MSEQEISLVEVCERNRLRCREQLVLACAKVAETRGSNTSVQEVCTAAAIFESAKEMCLTAQRMEDAPCDEDLKAKGYIKGKLPLA